MRGREPDLVRPTARRQERVRRQAALLQQTAHEEFRPRSYQPFTLLVRHPIPSFGEIAAGYRDTLARSSGNEALFHRAQEIEEELAPPLGRIDVRTVAGALEDLHLHLAACRSIAFEHG